MNYRSGIEILTTILNITKTGTTKTQIKYRAALTSRQVRHYLPLLVSNGKLKFDTRTRKYKITAKGSRLLDVEKMIHETLSRNKNK